MEIVIHEAAVRHYVSAVPIDWEASRYFRITLEWYGEDQWVVKSPLGRWMTPKGNWTWHLRYRGEFDLPRALELARREAPKMTIQGHTVAEVLEKGPEWC